jgi:hypothetical protein
MEKTVTRRGLVGLFFIALVMTASSALAARQAQVLEYGYYEFTKGSERLAKATTTSGYVTRGEAKLVEKTDKIPLERGRLFGFRFRISGMDKAVGAIPLELVVTHPEMKKPDGSLSTGYHYHVDLALTDGKVEDKTGYRINEPYEMVEGDWHFEYRFMDKVLIERTFKTYLPEEKTKE